MGGDEYGRKHLPPGSLEAQVQLLKAGHLPFDKCTCVISNPIFAKLVRWFLHLFFSPNLLEGIGFRKLYIEERVRHAIASTNITQVLVVAGGYDTLALRLSQEFSSVNFIELDHPATGRIKKLAVSNMMTPLPSNLFAVSADLTQCTLQQALGDWNDNNDSSDGSFVMSAPTAVVIEGLLMYLKESQVRELFLDITNMVGKGSMVCFDFLAWNHDTNRVDMGSLSSQFVHALVKCFGEPWYWGLASKQLTAFFQQFPCWNVTDQQQRVGIENVACVEFIGPVIRNGKEYRPCMEQKDFHGTKTET